VEPRRAGSRRWATATVSQRLVEQARLRVVVEDDGRGGWGAVRAGAIRGLLPPFHGPATGRLHACSSAPSHHRAGETTAQQRPGGCRRRQVTAGQRGMIGARPGDAGDHHRPHSLAAGWVLVQAARQIWGRRRLRSSTLNPAGSGRRAARVSGTARLPTVSPARSGSRAEPPGRLIVTSTPAGRSASGGRDRASPGGRHELGPCLTAPPRDRRGPARRQGRVVLVDPGRLAERSR
jgi:hypothetical protein